MNAKIQLAMWVAHPILESSIAGVMIWRKLHRTYPIFFAYLISQVACFGILFPIHQYGSYDLYFYSYWIAAVISLAIGFLVIHEIFQDVFRPYHTLKDLGTVLFKWAALVMIFVAIVVAAASPAGQSPLAQAVATLQRCVRTIQCGLVLFLVIFSRYLGVSWRQHGFGIILGFGGFASVQLVGNALYSGGQVSSPFTSLLYPTAYTCAVLTWLGYALMKAPQKAAAVSLLASQRWEQSLSDLRRPAQSDSLIPMFEGMVDRAFSRTGTEPDHFPVANQSLPQEIPSRELHPVLSARRASSRG